MVTNPIIPKKSVVRKFTYSLYIYKRKTTRFKKASVMCHKSEEMLEKEYV